jgi:response regulator RpfG family c-di-GMP phosphodiesterase
VARPTFLVIEVETPEGISSRKLVIETAKCNVLTAYSGKEGLELFHRHPVDGIVIHAAVQDIPCDELAKIFKAQRPHVPIVVLSPADSYHCTPADAIVPAYDPQLLLATLDRLVPAGVIQPPG